MSTDFQKKRKLSRFHQLLIAVAAVGALTLCIVLIVANINVYQKRQRLNTRIESLKLQIANLQNENKQFEEGIENANDSAYIEKLAREQLDFQRPGETVVSFVETPPENHEQKEENKGIFHAWLGWLSGWIK